MSGGEIIFQGSPSCCGACGAWCQRTKWTITTQYIEKESGLCCTTINTLQLIRVKDMNYAGGCCQSCGTITIFSSDETDPELHISGIPNSKDVYQKLRDAINKSTANARIEIQQN